MNDRIIDVKRSKIMNDGIIDLKINFFLNYKNKYFKWKIQGKLCSL